MAEPGELGRDVPPDVVWLTGGRQAACASKVYLRREHGEIQYGRRLGDIAVWWRGVRYDIEPGPARGGGFSRAGRQN